ncbi:cysteine-rich receptor-like protein kinase 44 isoform X4 [Rosa rugosa]|uniref:cysteine-rich receptor-like protein kinase 44 isoform X4 n=1 Tax=Rosa rugosa TaxID=74645 RepID=UPI002B4136C0|nr:cysteine-rich receptor-like protein kinase 44 isoform X4 [Rosa rugosa]
MMSGTSLQPIVRVCKYREHRLPFLGIKPTRLLWLPEFKLNCSGDAPSILIQEQEFRVLSINQSQSSFTIARADYWNNVCPVSLTNTTSHDIYSIDRCESICLNDCHCTAYGYSSSSSECSTWKGDLWADENGRTLHIRLAASDYKNKKTGRKRTIVIATFIATPGLLAIVFGYFLWKKTLGKRSETIKYLSAAGVENDTELPLFSLRSILVATNNFSEANKLGEGGFGPVYKGILPENQEVAIKRLSKKSGQGQQEFMNELKLIAKLQHTKLVRLLGCCTEAEEMMLIYEYMPNRSLDKFLFDPSEKTKLDWDRRLRIIEGIAQGLLYIHKYSRLKIIHRDLKASNILLDGTMNPKISDFGMAKIFDINQTEANTNRVVGTYGYMSPEYARYGHFSEKSDVFSFGVLLLEIVSGKKNSSFYRFERSLTLAGWAWDLWKEGRGIEVIDASIRETLQAHEALRCINIGLLCVQESAADRPAMASVIHMLQGNEAASLPPTKAPAFSTQTNFSTIGPSSQTPTNYSNNALTISLPEAR